VPIRLAEKLEKVSQLEERAKSYYIRKSLEQFLEERLEDIEDYLEAKEAHEAFKASGEKAISWDKVVKESNQKEINPGPVGQ